MLLFALIVVALKMTYLLFFCGCIAYMINLKGIVVA